MQRLETQRTKGQAASRGQAASSQPDSSKSLKAVQQELEASGYAELGNIQCELEAGRVILRGTVPSYHLKATRDPRGLASAGYGGNRSSH